MPSKQSLKGKEVPKASKASTSVQSQPKAWAEMKKRAPASTPLFTESKASRAIKLASTIERGVAAAYPARSGKNNFSGRTTQIKGHDFLGIVRTGASSSTGDVLLLSYLTPFDWPATRLCRMAGLYDRWKIKSMRFRYVPGCSTSEGGQLIGNIDRNVQDFTSFNGLPAVRRAASSDTTGACNVWEEKTWSVVPDPSHTNLYTNIDTDSPMWSVAGVFELVVVVPPNVSTELGAVYMDYDIEFSFDDMNDDVMNGAVTINGDGGSIAAPWGTTPYYGDRMDLSIPLPTDGATVYMPRAASYTAFVYAEATTLGTLNTTVDGSVDTFQEVTDGVRFYYEINFTVTGTRSVKFDITAMTGALGFSVMFLPLNPIMATGISGKLSRLSSPVARLFEAKKLGEASPWKLPATLVKMGSDWLSENGRWGAVKTGSKMFSKLVGWILDSGLLGSVKLTEPLDASLLNFWKTCGYHRALPSPGPTSPTCAVEEEKEWSVVRRR